MDYRCPICKVDLKTRKRSQTVIARMEIDCPKCKSTLRLNVHRAEAVLFPLVIGTIAALGAAAYWYQSGALVLLLFGVAMVGSLVMPLLERTLRDWPRYVSDKNPS
jgi:uncharacterized protein YbaR (Trm112 family)